MAKARQGFVGRAAGAVGSTARGVIDLVRNLFRRGGRGGRGGRRAGGSRGAGGRGGGRKASRGAGGGGTG